jgi:tetratricopeptide (TPR) repeat protein
VWLLSRLAAVLSDLFRGGRKLRLALNIGLNVVVLAALSVRTIARNEVYADAISLWADAAAKAPNRALPAFNLGTCLVRDGRYADAVAYLQRAEEIQPQQAEVHVILARAYTALDRLDEAATELEQAEGLMAEAPPEDPELRASILAALAQESWTLGNRYASRGQYAQAAELLDLLAAAQAQAGRLDEAVANATEALRLAQALGDEQLAESIRGRLQAYEAERARGQAP